MQYIDILPAQAAALFENETHPLVHAANLSALIYDGMPQLNWVGFYFIHDGELRLGPFQGKPACIRIPFGKGVCGAAAQQRRTLSVPDVHAFPGHIACDAASNSEVVIPLIKNGKLLGVLDVDSPLLSRFTPEDVAMLERLAACYLECSDFSAVHYNLQE